MKTKIQTNSWDKFAFVALCLSALTTHNVTYNVEPVNPQFFLNFRQLIVIDPSTVFSTFNINHLGLVQIPYLSCAKPDQQSLSLIVCMFGSPGHLHYTSDHFTALSRRLIHYANVAVRMQLF